MAPGQLHVGAIAVEKDSEANNILPGTAPGPTG